MIIHSGGRIRFAIVKGRLCLYAVREGKKKEKASFTCRGM